MTARSHALALTLLAAVMVVPSALAAPGRTPSVASSLDGKKVLPIRIRWTARPGVPASQVKEVDFLVDGKLRWVEHRAPYVFGGDDNGRQEGYLITTWLAPREHHFTASVVDSDGARTEDTVTARVLPALTPPSRLAGTWARTVTKKDLEKSDPAFGSGPPAGAWKLVFDRVGAWHLDPMGSGVVNEYDAHGDVVDVYAPIRMTPDGGGGVDRYGAHGIGGIDCSAAGPFGTYRWAVTGSTLTLTAIHEGCGQRRAIWEGTWTRAG